MAPLSGNFVGCSRSPTEYENSRGPGVRAGELPGKHLGHSYIRSKSPTRPQGPRAMVVPGYIASSGVPGSPLFFLDGRVRFSLQDETTPMPSDLSTNTVSIPREPCGSNRYLPVLGVCLRLCLPVLFSCKSNTVQHKTEDEIKAKRFISESIQKGANVNELTIFPDQSALHTAARFGWADSVELLLAHGADPHMTDTHGSTPLHEAVGPHSPRFTTTVQLLVQHHADVNAKDQYGRTPLHKAAESGNNDLVTMLLEAGADINATNSLGNMPIHEAAGSGSVQVS
jgi:hypothetical protein